SRRPDHVLDKDEGNDDLILLPDTLFVKTVDLDLKDRLKTATNTDDFFTKALLALQTHGTPPIKSDLSDWKSDEGLLLFKERCYVPPDQELRRDIVRRYHDSLTAGHPEHMKTLELVRRNYWWPGMYIFVKNYMTGCALCQQMKVNTHP